ncbi:TetR family transcriptional regulator [Catenulispora sp. NF23]|uniref:TetR family transcriptional regulator n=1 Tax=Catenulispora pinistramenti TaxID=2705254 RepID=A0ABS5KZ93_9ACTN|nr:TetR/AcrR family transcriptional regulator [Catenulispora pinistramenti]MBS2534779.1 TetR family transcriptional regulator [Catenulispora pinistramenti]MBS2551390.1 TetR family transcriptional regulator [Catenulispora pinistramenti]
MSRWPSNPRGRLQQAAMELFTEHGYDQTTVAGIAERAGLTERTFFRHFSDKREVLFFGGEQLEAMMVAALRSAPPEATPLGAIEAALSAVTEFFDERHPLSQARQVIIDAHPELQEREGAKMDRIAGALTEALRARGVPDPDARLTADAGIAVFRSAFAQWVRSDVGDMSACIEECLATLEKVIEQGR